MARKVLEKEIHRGGGLGGTLGTRVSGGTNGTRICKIRGHKKELV